MQRACKPSTLQATNRRPSRLKRVTGEHKVAVIESPIQLDDSALMIYYSSRPSDGSPEALVWDKMRHFRASKGFEEYDRDQASAGV